MGPKKQPIKEVPVEEVKKEQIIPPHELQGYGRFQYLNGTTYEGQWHLFDGVKMKHGQGVLIVSASSGRKNSIKEKYEGSWVKDCMQGYGVYQYPNGDTYRGQWLINQHHGQGQYQFSNGTIYTGEWNIHYMHGTGSFIDNHGRQWKGEYRKGKFETKKQKELIKQKQIKQLKEIIRKEIQNILIKMLELLNRSDKKTLKQNLNSYFSTNEIIKQLIKQPYIKLDQKNLQKWIEFITFIQNGNINILNSKLQSQIIGQQKIIKQQMQGIGQVVQIIYNKNQKNIKAAFVNVQTSIWILVAIKQ